MIPLHDPIKEQKLWIAYHEAGHVAGCIVGNIAIDFVTMDHFASRWSALGSVQPVVMSILQAPSDAQILMTLAGPFAECKFLNKQFSIDDPHFGKDIEQLEKWMIARWMRQAIREKWRPRVEALVEAEWTGITRLASRMVQLPRQARLNGDEVMAIWNG